jgi:hypothetical protein
VAVQVEGECCTVHFVDYGNMETVLWSDLVKVAADVWVSVQTCLHFTGLESTFLLLHYR